MTIASAFTPYEAAYRAQLDHQTWGHLFPAASTEPIRGQLRIAQTAYNGVCVLDIDIEVQDSPWWYESLHDFIDQYDLEMGQVAEVIIDVMVRKHIAKLPEMCEIEEQVAYEGWTELTIECSQPEYFERIEIKEVENFIVMEGLK